MGRARHAGALLAASLALVLLPAASPADAPRARPAASAQENPAPPPPGQHVSHPTDQLPGAPHPGARTGLPAATGIAPFLGRPYWNQHAVTAIFDHCNPNYSLDGKVCEFNGTVASRGNGVDPGFPSGYAITPGRSDYLYYDGHNGWDLALRYEPVLAAAPGTVVIAGADANNSGFGQTITIDHQNGFTTRYAHLSDIWVRPGQTVARGQQIGVSGNTGNSTGPHLHFGLYITSSWTAIDPWGWTGSGPDPWGAFDSGDYWITGNPHNFGPSAPSAATAAAGIGSAWVSWTPPASDGGSSITSYTVTSSPGRLTATVAAGSTSAVVGGLSAGTSYSFTVTAGNAQGMGRPSGASNAVVPLRPFNGAWDDLGGTLTSAPAAASWAPGRQDVFVRGTDNALWHRWWDGQAWGGWESLGGVLTADPAVAARAAGRLDVFVTGTDGAVWEKSWNGSAWSQWGRLDGASTASAPAVAAWAPSHLDLFVRAGDGSLIHRSWNGLAWSSWESLGGSLGSSPAAVSWAPNRVDVFAEGSDGGLRHTWWDGARWQGWEGGGGVLTAAPAVASEGPGLLEVIVRGSDLALYRKRWLVTGWTGWQGLGGSWATAPGAASQPGPLTVDVFESGGDRRLKHAAVD
jgi:murein DD-endopeptidase MepM/ murein hydrolase activator NlpD